MWLQNSPDFSFGTAFMKVKHIKINALTVYNNFFLLVLTNFLTFFNTLGVIYRQFEGLIFTPSSTKECKYLIVDIKLH